MIALRILIVEDEALVARDLRNTLVKLGYEVTFVARTATEAIASVQEQRPDLALLDIRLADGSDGIEAAQVIQGEHKVPVVFLTAHGDERTMQRARAAEPYGYLLKPFHESEIRSVVELAVARHQANSRLEAREAQIANTLRSMADGVISTDLFGKITFMNAVAERMTGWALDEAKGLQLPEVFKISLPGGGCAEPLGLPAAANAISSRSILLTSRSGAQEMIEDSTTPIRDAEGALAGIVVLFRGKMMPVEVAPYTLPAMASQETSLPNLAGIVHSIIDPMVAMDADWKITYLNPQAAEILEGRQDAIVGREVWECFPPSIHRLYYHEFSQALAKGKARSFEMETEAERRWFEVQLYPFGNGLLALLRDVTDRKAKEEQERKMEKLESLGLLARGFAHDFNNLLTVLLGNISLAEMQTTPQAPGHTELVTAKQATLQAQGLVQHLLTFARGGMPIKQPTDMGRLVREWLAEWPKHEGIEYAVDISDRVMQADVDRKQLARLLHNLMRNAEQAIVRTGAITIRLKSAVDAIGIQNGLPQETNFENWLLLQVADDGAGIELEDQQRVFEPYFTTREDANASGLGLTVCESIAKAHGAILELSSAPKEGTVINLWIPAYQPPAAELLSKNEPEPASVIITQKRPRRILILEDEMLIRHLMVATLKSIGCEVTATADGTDTVARFEEAQEHEEPFQLLIMDLSIPNGMGGLQAMDRIRHIDPAARAIVSSGYCDDPVLSRYMDYGFRAVLPKPYQPNELKAMVESMLRD